MDMKFEVAVILVRDADRAKEFCGRLSRRHDAAETAFAAAGDLTNVLRGAELPR